MSNVARYRTRQIEVDAIRWTGADNCEQVFVFLGLNHRDDDRHELIDITGRGGWQAAEVGDWIVRDAEGDFEVVSHEEFTDEFKPVTNDEPELGWDEVIAHHPPISQLRIPLNHDGNDAGVLVLDDKQGVKLANGILGMVSAENKFFWGQSIGIVDDVVDIPLNNAAGEWVGRLLIDNRADVETLRDMLDGVLADD